MTKRLLKNNILK